MIYPKGAKREREIREINKNQSYLDFSTISNKSTFTFPSIKSNTTWRHKIAKHSKNELKVPHSQLRNIFFWENRAPSWTRNLFIKTDNLNEN